MHVQGIVTSDIGIQLRNGQLTWKEMGGTDSYLMLSES